MSALDPTKIIALPTDCKRYQGIAFDGCTFYLTAPQECRIYKFNENFVPIGCVEMDQPYSCICYDNAENCFWASSDQTVSVLYKLDCNLNAVCCVKLSGCANPCTEIVGLSHNCKENTLVLAFAERIAEFSKCGCCVRVLQEASAGCYAGAVSLAPSYAAVRRCGQAQEIALYCPDGSLVKSCCLPAQYTIEDLVFYPCKGQRRLWLRFLILATKSCCPKLLCCEIPVSGLEVDCCNYEVLSSACDCDEDGDCACDLIESVALVETALSHILNAEGEKLQKAVEIAEDVCDLLEANRSVHRTIIHVTQLEHILYAKLDALGDLDGAPRACTELEAMLSDLDPDEAVRRARRVRRKREEQ